MNAELEEYKKQMLKKTRLTIYLFSFCAMVAMLALTYGFIQQIDAVKAKNDIMVEMEKCDLQVKVSRQQLDSVSRRLEQAIIEMEIAKATAEAGKQSKK